MKDAALILDVVNFAIDDMNEAADKLYGYTKEEFEKMTVFDLLPQSEHERVHDAIDVFRG